MHDAASNEEAARDSATASRHSLKGSSRVQWASPCATQSCAIQSCGLPSSELQFAQAQRTRQASAPASCASPSRGPDVERKATHSLPTHANKLTSIRQGNSRFTPPVGATRAHQHARQDSERSSALARIFDVHLLQRVLAGHRSPCDSTIRVTRGDACAGFTPGFGHNVPHPLRQRWEGAVRRRQGLGPTFERAIHHSGVVDGRVWEICPLSPHSTTERI